MEETKPLIPVGAFLKMNEIESVAERLYSRFEHEYGLKPSLRDNKAVQNRCKVQVMKVLDALSIAGFKVVPMEPDEERLPKCKK